MLPVLFLSLGCQGILRTQMGDRVMLPDKLQSPDLGNSSALVRQSAITRLEVNNAATVLISWRHLSTSTYRDNLAG